MAGVSVVIPIYRDDAELADLLRSLRPLSIDEIIIVDGEDRAQPPHLKAYATQEIVWHTAKHGRGAQIAAGISKTSHPNIWVLHADCRPASQSLLEIHSLLKNPKTSLACFPLAFRRPSISLSVFALLSHIDSPLTTFGDQGFAFRKSDYESLDLTLSDYPLLEDVALRRALRRLGHVRKAHIKLPISARRFERLGVWKTQIRNIGILLRYWRGMSPKTLHAQYYQTTRQTVLASQPSSLELPASKPVQASARKTENDCPGAVHLRLPETLYKGLGQRRLSRKSEF